LGEKDTNKKSFRHYDEFTKRFYANEGLPLNLPESFP
jgi:hypothetical protein